MHLDERLIIPGRTSDRESRALQRASARADLHRIRRGAYVEQQTWQQAKPLERHLLALHAEILTTPDAVVSHRSAAMLHGLPVLGVPRVPEFRQSAGARNASSATRIRRSALDDGDPVRLGEANVVPVERTLVDLAASLPLREALIPLDAHLRRGGSIDELLHLLQSIRIRGARRAELAILLADGSSENGGESLSRGTMLALGFPVPMVQMAVPGSDLRTDFGWLRYRVRGELDGDQKYEDPRYTGGRTPAEIVLAEKRREALIRSLTGHEFARWSWPDALRVHPLRRELLRVGLPQGRPVTLESIRSS
ncbi:hypothetical protein [Arenivirga flava]|uniref:Transcriptional regulator, AbiEi antitoxin, Type IV TA system n=1 Tax=Arenivirga flava TaxID=1930060 RepID=A0AA37XBL2_9MICO|nr:hypothetical protein [Arenivirga flava]GMA28470.1 hypothetical protein GCM10025874_17230 [Arenivirga flava]